MACHCPECKEYLGKITHPTPRGIIHISKHVDEERRKDPFFYLPNYHTDNERPAEKIEIKTSDVLEQMKKEKKGRYFEGGAYRDSDEEKYDYEGFLCPLVIERYGEYMHKHRKQSDGGLRDSDNWQHGIPISQYMKSKWRHFHETWKLHRLHNQEAFNDKLIDSLCAELFNTMGMIHELIKKENRNDQN